MKSLMHPIRRACFAHLLISFPTRSLTFSAIRGYSYGQNIQLNDADSFGTPCHTKFVVSYKRQRRILLSAGRERRSSSASFQKETLNTISEMNLAEKKLLADEEAARQKRMGQIKQRQRKAASREDRISQLELNLIKTESMSESESYEYVTKAERAELAGLLKVRESFEEQYDPITFTKEHLEFKAAHNDAFLALSRYCEKERNCRNGGECEERVNLFFLDGPDGGTASALIHRGGFDASQCYVANRHESSCKSLRKSGGGLLPEENVIHATASEALTLSSPSSFSSLDEDIAPQNDVNVTSINGEGGAFSDIDFSAYYFDGCGGFVPHIIGMISSALLRQDCDPSKPIALGYSLLGGNKDIVGKELAISQAVTIIARRRGMRVVHVLDDPHRYGIPLDIKKVGGSNSGTFTTWLLLTEDSQSCCNLQ